MANRRQVEGSIRTRIRKQATFSLVTKRVGQRDRTVWSVSQELTQQLSIRHCQLVQCHELLEMRRPIMRMKNDPRKPLIFRPPFLGEYTKHGDGFLNAAWNKTNFHYSFPRGKATLFWLVELPIVTVSREGSVKMRKEAWKIASFRILKRKELWGEKCIVFKILICIFGWLINWSNLVSLYYVK